MSFLFRGGGYHGGYGGYGYGGGFGGGSGTGLSSLLTQLQNATSKETMEKDPIMANSLKLQHVSELCERLSLVQNESELSGLRVSELCRTLVALLNEPSDAPDIMLLSSRAMANLVEVLPGSASVLVDTAGCLPALLAPLLNIQYIDVAEQCVLTLNKLSRERALVMLRGGALSALLQFLDFFPLAVQRTALQTAANLVVRVSGDTWTQVMDAIPLVINKLNSKEGAEEPVHTAIILFFARITQNVVNATNETGRMAYGYSSYERHGARASGGSSSSSASSSSTPSPLSRLESSGMVDAVVSLLRHCLREPSLFASSALPTLLGILVSLTHKSATITRELMTTSKETNIIQLIADVYAHITGKADASTTTTEGPHTAAAATATAASSDRLPLPSPMLTSSPSLRASQAGASGNGASSQLLNPLLSFATELLPDMRAAATAAAATATAATSSKQSVTTDKGTPASARQLFQQRQQQASAAPTAGSSATPAPASASASTGPSSSASPSLSAAPASSSSPAPPSMSIGSSCARQLTFLSPNESELEHSLSLSTSPPAHMDADAEAQIAAEEEAEAMRREQMSEDGSESEVEREDDDEDERLASLPPPPPPSSATPSTGAADTATSAAAASSTHTPTPPTPSMLKSSLQESKLNFLMEHPDVLNNYIRTLLPLFLHASSSSTDTKVLHKCVSAILRICCVVQHEALADGALFPRSAICSFLHSILHSSDAAVVSAALHLMDTLLMKAEEQFAPQMMREGCVETVQEMSEQGMMAHSGRNGKQQHLTSSPHLPPLAAASATLQQRAKILLQKHFKADGESSSDEEEIGDELTRTPATSDAAPLVGSLDRSSTPMQLGSVPPSPALLSTPSKSKRRRISSVSTAIFQRAETLAAELQQLIDRHDTLCKQLHEKGKGGAGEASSAETQALAASMQSLEDSFVTCLRGICSCIVGTQAAPVAPSPHCPAQSATQSTTPPTTSPMPTTPVPTPVPVPTAPGDVLTTHELLRCGLIDALLTLLFHPTTGEHAKQPHIGAAAAPLDDPWRVTWNGESVAAELALQRRHRLFCHVFFHLPRTGVPVESESKNNRAHPSRPSDVPSSSSSNDSIGDVFVKRFVEALESVDACRLRSSGMSAAQGTQAFANPFRVRISYRPDTRPMKEQKQVEPVEVKEHVSDEEEGEDEWERSSAMETGEYDDASSSSVRRSSRSRGSKSAPALATAASSPALTTPRRSLPPRAAKSSSTSNVHATRSSTTPASAPVAGSSSSSSSSRSRKGSRTSSRSPAPKQRSSFGSAISSAVSAIRSRISGRRGSGASASSSPASTCTPPPPHLSRLTPSTIVQLFPPRSVLIDSLATFASIESFLQENVSLFDLYERTERARMGKDHTKNAMERAQEREEEEREARQETEAAHARISAQHTSSRGRGRASSSKKKKKGSSAPASTTTPTMAALNQPETCSSSSIASDPSVDPELLECVRRSKAETQPLRLLFRFGKASSGASSYSSYASYMAARGARSTEEEKVEEAAEEWHDIGADRGLTLYEAIMKHHPNGLMQKLKQQEEYEQQQTSAPSTILATASGSGGGSNTAPRPFSPYELLHSQYDIEFRLIPADSDDHSTSPSPSSSSSTKALTHRKSSKNATKHDEHQEQKQKADDQQMLTESKKDQLDMSTLMTSGSKSMREALQQRLQALSTDVQPLLGGNARNSSTLASLLLLLDSFHFIAHHWSHLYTSWPAMVDFFLANDGAGSGSTGRGLPLPLSVISQSGAHMQTQLPFSHSFISQQMSRKLMLQCEDAIVTIGGCLPPWTSLLTRSFPFLFHFSSRELLFRCTAFTPPRHLLSLHQHLMTTQPHAMQQLQGAMQGNGGAGGGGAAGGGMGGGGMMHRELFDESAASSDDEAEGFDEDGRMLARRRGGGIGGDGGLGGSVEMQNQYRGLSHNHGEESQLAPSDRISSLKVRVDRFNVLNAARQLFLQHAATRKCAIRAEFMNEAGVGIGPTLEFFTLVSQQMQLKKLHIWNKAETNNATCALPSASKQQQPSSSKASMQDQSDAMEEENAGMTSSAETSEVEGDAAAMDTDEPETTSARGATAASRERKRKRRGSTSAPSSPQTRPIHGKRARNFPDQPLSSPAAATATETSIPFISLRASSHPPSLHHAVASRLNEFFDLCVIDCPSCHLLEVPLCQQHGTFLTIRESDGQWRCAGKYHESEEDKTKKQHQSTSSGGKKKSSSKKKGSRGRTASKQHHTEDESATSSTASSSDSICATTTRSMNGVCHYCVALSSSSSSASQPRPASSSALPLSSSSSSFTRRQLKHWRLNVEEADYVLSAFPKNVTWLSHMILYCSTCLCVNFPGYHASSYAGASSSGSMLVVNRAGQMVNHLYTIMSERSYRSVTRHVTHVCDNTPLHMTPALITKSLTLDRIEKGRSCTPRMGEIERKKKESSKKQEEDEAKTESSTTPSSQSQTASTPVTGTESDVASSTSTDHAASSSAAESQGTVAASSAFDSPSTEFVASSALYPPPALQSLVYGSSGISRSGVSVGALEWLWLLGRFIGQALMEQRLLDLPLSRAMLARITEPLPPVSPVHTAAIIRAGNLSIAVPAVPQQIAPLDLLHSCASIPPPPPSVLLPLLIDLLEISPHLAKPMFKILAICYHRFSPAIYPLSASLQHIDGASIEDLSFSFSLPAHPELELVSGGSDLSLTAENAHIWIWLVCRQMMREGVTMQMQAIQQGIQQVLDAQAMQTFYAHELDELVSGGGASSGGKLLSWDWSVSKLRSAVKFRQGYHPDSPAIQYLLTIMSELTPQQQRAFTRFITGSPSLPGGSIAALNPPLTVVKIELKQEETEAIPTSSPVKAAANVTTINSSQSTSTSSSVFPSSQWIHVPLPTVMTCSHYLKLPNYSSLELMREKILVALQEGSQGFTLS